MHIRHGNIFHSRAQAIVIPTNGWVKGNGEAVMGRGIAFRIKQLWPDVAKIYGTLITSGGHRVHTIKLQDIPYTLIMFPVKPDRLIITNLEKQVVISQQDKFKDKHWVPGWACRADVLLIERSCRELVDITTLNQWQKVELPMVGCGNGELTWDQVRPILEKHLDSRFTALTYNPRSMEKISIPTPPVV